MVTENKAVALDALPGFYRQIFYKSGTGMAVYDEAGQCIAANEALARAIGVTVAEVLSQNCNQQESWKGTGLFEVVRRAFEEKVEMQHEITVTSTSGRYASLDCRLVPFAQSGQQFLLFVADDITELKRVERALTEEKNRHEAIVAALGDGITVQDKDFNIIFQNDVHRQMQGDHLGEQCYRAYNQRDDICPGCLVLKTFADGHGHRRETTSQAVDGRAVYLEVSSSPLRNARGEVIAAVEAVRDVTARKEIEQEKERLEAHLSQARKMEAIGTMAGGIAHDFNNILAIIMGYAELAIFNQQEGKGVAGELKEINKAAIRARDLVRQILSFSRKADRQLRLLAPHVIIGDSLKLLRATLPTTITIHQDIDADCGTINSDPTQIHQIVMNLATNATHAMGERGVLGVALKSVYLQAGEIANWPDMLPGRYVRLSVSDTGGGMSPEVAARIFEPFFTTKEVGKGTGMGLAVVHGIVMAHHGMIVVESEPGKGTTFDVYFAVAEGEELMLAQELETMPTGSERILVVDDEQELLAVVQWMLELHGYKATIRESAAEALALFRTRPQDFDLVITDQTMPEMTGEELAAELLAIRPQLPVILCTGYSSLVSGAKAAQLGLKAFLMKPLEQGRFLSTVRKVLDGGKVEPAN